LVQNSLSYSHIFFLGSYLIEKEEKGKNLFFFPFLFNVNKKRSNFKMKTEETERIGKIWFEDMWSTPNLNAADEIIDVD